MSGELEKRASDAEREQAIARLREAATEGRLTLEELADRAALAYGARSQGELARLTEDLPAAAAPPSRQKPVRWTFAVIGKPARKGHLRIAGRTSVVMGIGDCHLDLRQAELDGDEVTVTVAQVVADTTIVVPHHVDVELSGFLLIGNKTDSGPEADVAPSAPRVRIRVFGLIGELKVVRR
ncbi:MAG TPA: DUF1707 domain-containing protein [Gaiellaceae bacterium]|nr:DUF1707 domain-containing protein [Gaiellaceae bacterium]